MRKTAATLMLGAAVAVMSGCDLSSMVAGVSDPGRVMATLMASGSLNDSTLPGGLGGGLFESVNDDAGIQKTKTQETDLNKDVRYWTAFEAEGVSFAIGDTGGSAAPQFNSKKYSLGTGR